MSDDIDALRDRVAELEAREEQHARAATVQDALYRIAEAASSADDLQAFYATVHEIVGGLMYAENAYIALYDEQRQAMNYPYYVDAVDDDLPDHIGLDAGAMELARFSEVRDVLQDQPLAGDDFFCRLHVGEHLLDHFCFQGGVG